MSLSYQEWEDALCDGDLLGVACADCDATYGTPVSVCHDCGGRDLETVHLPTEGTLHSVTLISVPPAGFEGQYHVGLVQLGDARVMARIEGGDGDNGDEPEIGDDVVFTDVIDDGRHSAPVFRV